MSIGSLVWEIDHILWLEGWRDWISPQYMGKCAVVMRENLTIYVS